MKEIPTDVTFDRNYIMACMAIAGHNPSIKGLERIIDVSPTTAQKRFEKGEFTRKEMLLFAEKCYLDTYDFMRCFFTPMLLKEDTQKYAVKELLIKMLVDNGVDSEKF